MKQILGLWLVSLFLFQSAAAADRKMVEIVLDASGSMNGRLADGQAKIEATKEAVTRLAERLPDSLVLAFRAYGHQSPRQKKDCQDTQLLTGFGPLGEVRGRVSSQAKELKAQGYTPITYVLGLAALDFPSEESAENIIILVSDGKETCEGDPCVVARNLKEKNVRLAVHTIGFGVDEATKKQLDCISRVTGGTYFGAESMDELIRVLTEAVSTKIEVPVESKGPGWIQVQHASFRGHRILDVETQEEHAEVSSMASSAALMPGTYQVMFGELAWPVTIEPGKKSVLNPGVVTVNRASYRGHVIRTKDGKEVGGVSNIASSMPLPPGEYTIEIEGKVIPFSLKEGQELTFDVK